ncbi:MAG: 5'-methylthioadenosine/S-adenosylhomocysteine nucleosidase [bacterium]|nr:5'-methylthioadenosine/S-adenosylhomocysteine nucleosidase [bacterium]
MKADGPEGRPKPYRCSAQVIDRAQALSADGAFVGVLEGRKLHVRDYASGEKVLMDRASELRQRILELSPDVYAFEMEGHGLLHSVWEAARGLNVQCGVVKSVSDFGDAGMPEGKDERQRQASRRAVRVAVELLRHF